MRGARRPASRKSARPTWMRRKGASGTCWRSRRIQETLGGRSSIETTLAVLRFRNRLVIEAWLGTRLRQRRGRENGDRDGPPSAQHKTRCGSHQTLPLPPTVAALRRGGQKRRGAGDVPFPLFRQLSAGDANVVAADVGRVASTARLKPRASEAKGFQTLPPNVNPARDSPCARRMERRRWARSRNCNETAVIVASRSRGSGRAGQCPQKACAWSLIRSSMTNAGRSSWPIPTVSERSWARDVALEPRGSL
jgi:hypothetical protein